jgi:hypothetical protein
VKALTICQPYAHLIAQGRKTCENRTWETRYRGLLYIHAGKSRQWLNLDEDGTDDGIHVDQMEFGAVVAICRLAACLHIDSRLLPEWTAKMTDEQKGHVSGEYCWILTDVHPVQPFPWKGAQGLWDCDAVTRSAQTVTTSQT